MMRCEMLCGATVELDAKQWRFDIRDGTASQFLTQGIAVRRVNQEIIFDEARGDICGCALHDDLTAIQNTDGVGLLGFLQIMGREKNGRRIFGADVG